MNRATTRLITAAVVLLIAAAVVVLIGMVTAGSDASRPVSSPSAVQSSVSATAAADQATQPTTVVATWPAEPSPTEGINRIQATPSPTVGDLPSEAPIEGIERAQATPTLPPVSKELPSTSTAPAPVTVADASLQIPRINVSAKIVPVGVTETGNMAAPSSPWEIGWYKFGAKPGEPGKVVLAGHLDSQEGPAIFWNLDQLQRGDSIRIQYGDGTTYTYAVTEPAVYEIGNAPLGDIFGSHGRPELILITCDGTFDHSTHNYDQRLVVYTELVSPL